MDFYPIWGERLYESSDGRYRLSRDSHGRWWILRVRQFNSGPKTMLVPYAFRTLDNAIEAFDDGTVKIWER